MAAPAHRDLFDYVHVKRFTKCALNARNRRKRIFQILVIEILKRNAKDVRADLLEFIRERVPRAVVVIDDVLPDGIFPGLVRSD